MLLTPPQGRSREEILRDAAEATRLMESPLLKQFFEGAPSYLTKQFVASTSPEDREILWAEAQGIERLRVFLSTLAENGKFIEKEIADEDKARSTARQEPVKRN